MKGRCTWNKFLNRTTQHWGRSDQFACDTFCSSCEKNTPYRRFPKVPFWDSSQIIFHHGDSFIFPQTSHSGQCHDSTQIESNNLLCSSKPFPLCLFLIPSPPELSCERKSSCLSSDFRLPCLLRLFSQPPKYQLWLGNLEARNSSKNDKRKVSKDIDCSILNAKDINFCWLQYIAKLILFCYWMQSVLGNMTSPNPGALLPWK